MDPHPPERTPLARRPTLADVLAARERLHAWLQATPVRRSEVAHVDAGVELWLKLETLQPTGSFKVRGAASRVAELASAGARRVMAASAGNHGLGVALAAARLGLQPTIVVPRCASPAKLAALRRAGVDLRITGRDFDEAEAAMYALASAEGVPVASPYDPAVIAGHATVALELLEQVPAPDVLLVPAGSGGLLAGCALVARALAPATRVIGLCPEVSPAMTASLRAGRIVEVACGASLADGLVGNIGHGHLPFELVRELVHEVVEVPEEEIAGGMRWLLEHEHLVVEGSGAIGVGALLAGRLRGSVAVPAGRAPRVVALLTGANVALDTLARVIGCR